MFWTLESKFTPLHKLWFFRDNSLFDINLNNIQEHNLHYDLHICILFVSVNKAA